MAPLQEHMTPDDVMARAVALAGSDDFGPDGFREGLARTLAAFEGLPLLPHARQAAYASVVDALVNRLRIEAWYKQHPEIEQQRIEGPLLVFGLPRTGTTATVGMLALDERFRFPRTWEALSPTPPPVIGEEGNDPRAVAAREAAKAYEKPEMHIHDPDGPEEDLSLLAPFNLHASQGMWPIPDWFVQWWIDADFTSTFAYHARTLKLLQSRRPPNRWLLKAPMHVFKLDAFAAQYPNAKFVMTHRDPLKVIPSVASLYHRLYETRCIPGAIDKHKIGARQVSMWKAGAERAMASRERIGEHRFIDVYNDDVIKDPIGVFERIYDHIGLKMDAGMPEKIEQYKRVHAPGARGAHVYTLEEYGLNAADVRRAFAPYIERFKL